MIFDKAWHFKFQENLFRCSSRFYSFCEYSCPSFKYLKMLFECFVMNLCSIVTNVELNKTNSIHYINNNIVVIIHGSND